MKKFMYSVLAAATMLFATTSCSQEEEMLGGEANGNNTQQVTFTVQMPGEEVNSRAIADGVSVGEGNKANNLIWALYEKDKKDDNGNPIKLDCGHVTGTKNAETGKHEFIAKITMVKGLNYNVLFFAYDDEKSAFQLASQVENTDLTALTLKKDELVANEEGYDAFVKCHPYTFGGETDVELTRPFAQINAATTENDLNKASQLQAVVTKSELVIKNVPTQYNVLKGEATENEDLTYDANDILKHYVAAGETNPTHPNEDIKVDNVNYKYLTMAYVLAGETSTSNASTHETTFKFYRGTNGDDLMRTINIPHLPIQRNYRTNLIGDLLTQEEAFKVVIEAGFTGDHNVKEITTTYKSLQAALNANTDNTEELTYNVEAPEGETLSNVISITIPDNTAAASLNLNLKDLEANSTITITNEGDNDDSYNKNVIVEVPEGINLDNLTIELPSAHVTIKQGKFEKIIASTSNTTLEIPRGVTVKKLEITSGNAEIYYGAVTDNITYNKDNTKITWLIDSKEQFANFAEDVNNGKNFKDEIVKLTADIDLNNAEWTPIGTEENSFEGTFDGKGYTIKNLHIVEEEAKEGKAFIGFFGYAKNATIKNVTFENVNLNIACLDIDHSQGHIGAVAGSLEGTSTIENVTIKGDIKVESTVTANGASRVAVVAGGNSYGNVTMKNVHVIANEGSYLKANNNVGALAGQLQGKSVFENCSSNIDVTGTKFFAGGIIGLAAGDQKFSNCQTTGDITITAGREGKAHDHYRVGGIAGGWADGAKNVCTLTNCSYTGQLSGTNADGSVAETFDYAGYVGRGYTLNGCQGSKVIIDGVEYVQAYNTAAEAGIYYVDDVLTINSVEDLKLFAKEVNDGTNYFEGKTIKLGADIDLNYEEWTPIGSAAKDHGFMGNFDGNGYIIKNLEITNITPDADGYVYAGLFGVTEGTEANRNSIKNLTIENVNIETTGHIVSAAIAYPYYTTVENITVKGNINIKGGDYTAGVLAYTRRCYTAKDLTISGNSGSKIIGNITVGGVISDIQSNGGDVNYSNFNASGLTIKGEKSVGGISGIISLQTLDGVTVKNVSIECNDARTGIVAGALGGKSTITNVSYENVTGATRIIGATYDNGYYIGQILEVGDTKAIVYTIEDGVKAVSVDELNLNGKNWSNAISWAVELGEGWALATIDELDAIHAVRATLNDALEVENAENALFCENDYFSEGKYAIYISSTEAEGKDPQGEQYFANRIHLKYFNIVGYWDYPLSTFATISKSAPLKENYFARGVYKFAK